VYERDSDCRRQVLAGDNACHAADSGCLPAPPYLGGDELGPLLHPGLAPWANMWQPRCGSGRRYPRCIAHATLFVAAAVVATRQPWALGVALSEGC